MVLIFALSFIGMLRDQPRAEAKPAPRVLSNSGTLQADAVIQEARLKQGLDAETEAARGHQPTSLGKLEESGDWQKLPHSEQESLWTAFSEARRTIYPIEGPRRNLVINQGAHFFTQNPKNQIVARFLDDGVRYQSGLPGRDWQVVIRLVGSTPREIRQQGTRLEYDHDGILEWHANHPEGMQQGFVIADRPVGSGDGGLRLQ